MKITSCRSAKNPAKATMIISFINNLISQFLLIRKYDGMNPVFLLFFKNKDSSFRGAGLCSHYFCTMNNKKTTDSIYPIFTKKSVTRKSQVYECQAASVFHSSSSADENAGRYYKIMVNGLKKTPPFTSESRNRSRSCGAISINHCFDIILTCFV